MKMLRVLATLQMLIAWGLILGKRPRVEWAALLMGWSAWLFAASLGGDA